MNTASVDEVDDLQYINQIILWFEVEVEEVLPEVDEDDDELFVVELSKSQLIVY